MQYPLDAKTLTFVAMALVLAGCGTDPVAGDTTASLASMGGRTTVGGMGGSTTTDGPSDAPSITPVPVIIQDTTFAFPPNRQVDLVFMIDNSPSMAPKQQKLKAQFPSLISALKDPVDGTLPDLRIAIVDSDLGTGGQQPQDSNCGPNSSNGGSVYGDLGRFQMINASACGVLDSGARWLEYTQGKPVNFAGDISTVFGCLATGVGTTGCGYEHQLQSLEFAFVVGQIGNEAQHAVTATNPQGFLRPSAYLGLVILSDEDDCSAATNDGLFATMSSLVGEAASLRCATRAHACGGKNLTTSPPGYPTDRSFTADFSTCSARSGDECPNPTDGAVATDTSKPTDCNPLKSVRQLAEEIKALKSVPDGMIVVAGIFGLPPSGVDVPAAQYKIAPVPNPNVLDAAHPTVFDYWPVCYAPDHLPENPDPATGFDPAAAAFGATGGLRLSAFVDEFGVNGLKFSICEQDFSRSMKQIGDTFAKRVQNLCLTSKLVDMDTTLAGVQPDCRVVYGTLNSQGVFVEDTNVIPQCDASEADTKQPEYPCWKLTFDASKCADLGQLMNVIRDPASLGIPLPSGTKLRMSCKVCNDNAGASSVDGCNYAPLPVLLP